MTRSSFIVVHLLRGFHVRWLYFSVMGGSLAQRLHSCFSPRVRFPFSKNYQLHCFFSGLWQLIGPIWYEARLCKSSWGIVQDYYYKNYLVFCPNLCKLNSGQKDFCSIDPQPFGLRKQFFCFWQLQRLKVVVEWRFVKQIIIYRKRLTIYCTPL